MPVVPVRAALLGLAFAIVLGASFSFLTSPWSTAELTWDVVWPIVVGAALGFGFGLLAAWKPRLGWAVWLLTVPAMAGLMWIGTEQCLANTPDEECGIVWMIFFGWLVPWSIGILVLGTFSFRAGRERRERQERTDQPRRPGLEPGGPSRTAGQGA
jgi:hypothetical protein